VLPVLDEASIVYKRLPSTSPANASIPYRRKVAAWKAVVQPGQASRPIRLQRRRPARELNPG